MFLSFDIVLKNIDYCLVFQYSKDSRAKDPAIAEISKKMLKIGNSYLRERYSFGVSPNWALKQDEK